jgi:hypothetical protein
MDVTSSEILPLDHRLERSGAPQPILYAGPDRVHETARERCERHPVAVNLSDGQ